MAYSRLEKELARDGRNPGVLSNGVHKKSISEKHSGAGLLFYDLILMVEGRDKFFSYSFSG